MIVHKRLTPLTFMAEIPIKMLRTTVLGNANWLNTCMHVVSHSPQGRKRAGSREMERLGKLDEDTRVSYSVADLLHTVLAATLLLCLLPFLAAASLIYSLYSDFVAQRISRSNADAILMDQGDSIWIQDSRKYTAVINSLFLLRVSRYIFLKSYFTLQ